MKTWLPVPYVENVESSTDLFARIFLLSPARIGGPRSNALFQPKAAFDLAIRLRDGRATIGETYAFVSALYFRGKLAYAEAFAAAPAGIPPILVIVPGIGLISPDTPFSTDHLRRTADVAIDEDNERYRTPLLRDAELLNRHAGPDCRYVLLGSIATSKYTEPLLNVFGNRLLFPLEFIGRGDMSRGGLMLRRARSREELSYVPIQGATLHGHRPAKLEPLKKVSDPQ
jgi:hypothetical protein